MKKNEERNDIMSKKLWNWFYLKPVDHLDILSSENIDKGKKMHEAIHKRMKELIVSGPPLKVVGPTEPICFMHCADADNVFAIISDDKKECDCELKILKNRNSKNHEKILSWSPSGNIMPTIKTTVESAKLQMIQMNGRQLRTEKIQANKKYDIDFVNFAIVNNPVDLAAKTKPIVGFSKLQNNLTENKPSQVSICSSCSYYNEWIPFDPDYKCYKCKKGL